MLQLKSWFDLPLERVWMNAAHQGPLPLRAAEAALEMIRWKTQPHHLQRAAAFVDLPERLRSSLARLIGARPSQVVLANSASYGLHLMANGLNLDQGDEIVVAANDFPSDILPWLRLQRFGVTVKQISPAGSVLTSQEVGAAISPRTRVVCLTWIHSFSGHSVDLDAIGAVCRDADALFVVNGSQGVGGIPISVADHPIDALISVGFKWLCGPYGTGFCWVGPRTEERLQPTKLYWLNSLSTEDLEKPGRLDLSQVKPAGIRDHDVFGTANFFNFAAFAEAVEVVREIGVSHAHHHNLALVQRLVDGVERESYEVQERGHPGCLSSILFLRPITEQLEEVAIRLETARVDVALRSGMIRLSPHFYNSASDVDRVLDALHS